MNPRGTLIRVKKFQVDEKPGNLSLAIIDRRQMVQSALAVLASNEALAAPAHAPTVAVIGRSHIAALAASATEGKKAAYGFLNTSKFEPIAKPGQVTEIADPLRSELLTLTAEAKLAGLLIGGNQHIAQSLFRRTPPIEVVLSDYPDLPLTEGYQLVPERLFLEFFERTQADLKSVLAFLRAERPQIKLVVMGAPPPIADASFILERLDPILREFIAKNGISAEPSSVAPAVFRWKVWHLLNRTFRDAAKAYDAEWLLPPASTFDDTGRFLAREFWGTDATHANASYGDHRFRQLEAFL